MIEWLVRKKVFRNENHAIWFLCTGVLFLVVLFYYFLPDAKFLIIVVPAVIHIPPFITSIATVHFQKRQSGLYSRDCIWFNGVMLLIYSAFAILIL